MVCFIMNNGLDIRFLRFALLLPNKYVETVEDSGKGLGLAQPQPLIAYSLFNIRSSIIAQYILYD